MATPLGHGLIGLAMAGAGQPRSGPSPAAWSLFATVAACAPDFDFLPGLLVGDPNRYHQLGSHSLLAVALFAILAGVFARRWPGQALRMALWSGAFYASHLVLDMLTYDGRAPYGLPLWWPVSTVHYIAPFTPLIGVRHGVPGDDLATVFANIFSTHNLTVLGTELLVVGPPALLFWWIGRRRAQRA